MKRKIGLGPALAVVLALGFGAPWSVATPAPKVPGASSFAVFSQPVDTRDDASLIGCTKEQAANWDGPKPYQPCWAPMREHSRLIYDSDGLPAAIAPLGRWVCLSYGPSASCQTITEARRSQLVFYSKSPSSGPGPYRIRLVQLVPNRIKSVRIGRKTFKSNRNLVIAKVSEQVAIAYMRKVAAAARA